ncbi:hypothetical protein LCGC14_1951100 [marine sediment metagenome]|uniref:Uncharacterized protein n=1 Tax=marine sediment metagenome TaxID=412755 RepID=A0A0F9IEH5_9ZZZZ
MPKRRSPLSEMEASIIPNTGLLSTTEHVGRPNKCAGAVLEAPWGSDDSPGPTGVCF